LKSDFRDDVFSALLIGWQAVVRGSSIEDLRGKAYEALPGEETRHETFWMGEMARFAAFAVQRGYLERDVLLDEDAWNEALVRGFVRKAAAAMGYAADGSLPRELTALFDPEILNAVYQSGLKSSGMTEEEFNALLEPALPDLFGGGTNGEVFWRCNSEPIMTNGEYKSVAGEVRWYAVGRKGCAPAQVLFATWAEPDEEFQRGHFGKSVLLGEALSEYVSWLVGLSSAEKAQWDEFVASLKPGNDLQAKLQGFRFRAAVAVEPASKPTEARTESTGEPVHGATLILRWLGTGEE
jgi:hypothetical protein